MTPTLHKAGSLGKIDEMRARAERGEPVFVDGDCLDQVNCEEESIAKDEVHRRIVADVDGLREMPEKQRCVPKARRLAMIKLRPKKRSKSKI